MSTNEELYPKPLTKEEFFQLAKNRNRYRVAKPLMFGELQYAKVGDTFHSDTLYERGYNMESLVEIGVLELIPDIFPFEKKIVGMNVHSVYTLCPECKTWGVNMPLEKTCGDCGYSKGWTFYDAETIDKYLRTLPTNQELTATNAILENRVLLLSKENDLIKRQLNEAWDLIRQYQELSKGLARPMQKEGGKG